MLSLVKSRISVAVMVLIMMSFKPAIAGMMGQMLGMYGNLANSIVVYDEDGKIALNSSKADVMLADFGEGAAQVETTLNAKANEVLHRAVEEAEVPEDAQAEFDETKATAEGSLNEINKVASLLVK